MTPQEKKVKRKEIKKNYNRMVKEHQANNLHPDSIATESPHFNTLLIFPSSPQSHKTPSHDMKIPKSRGTIVDIAPFVVQNLEVQTPEMATAQTIHRHRVTIGEKNALLSHRNRDLKQTLEQGLEGVRMESAMIRTTQLNRVWFTTIISLDQYILSVLSPSLFYSKNSYLLLLQVVSHRKLQFHHLIIAQVHRHNRQ